MASMQTAAQRLSSWRRGEANDFILEQEVVRVPVSALTFSGFRKWALSEQFPRYPRFLFLVDKVAITDWLEAEELIDIPSSAATLEGFCEWAESVRFPQRGRISYIDREIVIDMSPEELDVHNQVKTEVSRVELPAAPFVANRKPEMVELHERQPCRYSG